MARQILPWVGGAIGAAVGGWAGWQAGFAIGSLVGNIVDPQTISGPSIGEGQNNTASEGGYRPIVLGKGAVGVCMLNEGPLKKRTIRHKQGKGSGAESEEERFYRTMAFGLGESANPEQGVGLLRIWIDNQLRYDVTPTSQIVAESAEFANEFTFYSGTLDQQPDPDLEAFMGAGNVSAYPGTPYIVFPDYDVTRYDGRPPLIKVELATQSIEFDPQWEEIDVPSGNFAGSWFSSFNAATSSGYLFLSCSQGIYRYDNGNVVNVAPKTHWPTSMAISPAGEIVVPKVQPIRTIKSSGGGFSWEEGPNLDPQYGFNENGVCYNPMGWYESFSGDTAYKRISLDGLTWELPTEDAEDIGESFIHVRCVGGRHVGVTGTGLWVSDNDGEDWVKIINVPGGNCFATDLSFIEATGVWFFRGRRSTNNWSSHEECEAPLRHITYAHGVYIGVSSLETGEIVTHVSSDAFTTSQQYVSETATLPSFQIYGCWYVSGSNRVVLIADTPFSGKMMHFQFGSIAGEKIPLYSIVDWLHDRVNQSPSSFNSAQLVDEVEGIVFAEGYTAAGAVQSLMSWYFFDAGEFDSGSGYRINYIKRGGSAEATLTEDDIVDGPEDWEREDSYERPRVIHIEYQNPVADYGAPTVPIKRTSQDVLVVGERSVSVPIVHSDANEVARRGDVLMTVIYTEIAGTYEITLPDSFLWLAPTSVIGFSIRGKTRRLRMTGWRYVDGTIKTEWIADRQSAYTSNLTTLPAVPSTPPPPSIVGPTISAVLDIPALTDDADNIHLVVAASGQTEAWNGSRHQKKLASDPDFTTEINFSNPTTIMGVLLSPVSDASEHFTDTHNVVRVSLYSDDALETYNQQQFLSENGAFALSWNDGGTRRWEIMQYRDAVKIGERDWELTTLARGRLNTETAMHPEGSLFVLLDFGIRMMDTQTSWIGQEITHRGVSNGQSAESATPYSEIYTAKSQTEFPVAHVIPSLVGGSLSVTIVPRHRFGTDDHPVRSSNWTGYRVTASDGANTATIESTENVVNFNVSGWSAPITVSVSQLNRFTGAGPTVIEVVE